MFEVEDFLKKINHKNLQSQNFLHFLHGKFINHSYQTWKILGYSSFKYIMSLDLSLKRSRLFENMIGKSAAVWICVPKGFKFIHFEFNERIEISLKFGDHISITKVDCKYEKVIKSRCLINCTHWGQVGWCRRARTQRGKIFKNLQHLIKIAKVCIT